MFAAMRALTCLGLAAMLQACSGPPAGGGTEPPATAADSNYIAEVRITAADSTARLCGTGLRYQLTGPGMDSLLLRYRHANVRSGQWMKAWFAAHPGITWRHGLQDSALVVSRVHHLDASLACDPVPAERLSGTYRMSPGTSGAGRIIWLDLHADGTAVLRSLVGNAPWLEEEGLWGLDVEDHVVVKWPHRDHTMRYVAQDGRLLAEQVVNGIRPQLDRHGPVDRSAGAFGRACRWMLAAAGGTGTRIDTASITPTTLLSQALPDPSARAWLLRTTADTLGVDSAAAKLRWTGVSDVRGLMRMLRARTRRS